jgi:hypothetical protein
MGAHEDGESIPIPLLCQLHEVAIHPVTDDARPM